MGDNPRYSILHPTKRLPDGWQESAKAWIDRCSRSDLVEYVLCCDDSDFAKFGSPDLSPFCGTMVSRVESCWNHGEECSTAAYNAAAAASTGDLLICSADDVFPPQGWDKIIENSVIPMGATPGEAWFFCHACVSALDARRRDFLLWPGTGHPERDKHICFQPIMSRARYERLGYFFHPEYRAMFADNDLTEHAKLDGVCIKIPDLQLEHRHPVYGTAEMDWVYQHENKPENYTHGQQLFLRRQAEEFPVLNPIPGWFHPRNRFILDRLIQERDVKTVIEVGSFLGLSASWFASRVEEVFCIDRWDGEAFAGLKLDGTPLQVFQKNVGLPLPEEIQIMPGVLMRNVGHRVPEKIHIIRGESSQVFAQVPDADLVYIDADHSYEGCLSDLQLYAPKARKIVCGDDFQDREGWGVIKAVKEYFPHGNAAEPFWWVEK